MSKHVPRIYIKNLNPSIENEIPIFHVKHLISVLRNKHGDILYVFSESVGEWKAELVIKQKNTQIYAKCVEKIRESRIKKKLCLAFGVIKHDNLMWMIEKAVELGVTDLYPLMTDYTNIRTIKLDKILKNIVCATEQSGRISLPGMHDSMNFSDFMEKMNGEVLWFSAVERADNNKKLDLGGDIGFIIGPEGGFSDREKILLAEKTCVISLSHNILRAETAAISCLSIANYLGEA